MRIDWMWGWGGLGGVGLVGLVLFLVFWGLVIAALVLLIRRLVRSDERNRHDGPPPWSRYAPPPVGAPHAGPGAPGAGLVPLAAGEVPHPAPPGDTPLAGGPAAAPDALEILRQRYARGDIDETEFERRRAFLEDARGAGDSGGPGGSTGG